MPMLSRPLRAATLQKKRIHVCLFMHALSCAARYAGDRSPKVRQPSIAQFAFCIPTGSAESDSVVGAQRMCDDLHKHFSFYRLRGVRVC